MISFCMYLLRQGYLPQQIAILTMYTGQLLELRRVIRKCTSNPDVSTGTDPQLGPTFVHPTVAKLRAVRVCSVDNFQGEENDIVLLSLVRSNNEHKIGFLSEENRICVSLSRAKFGMYKFCKGCWNKNI